VKIHCNTCVQSAVWWGFQFIISALLIVSVVSRNVSRFLPAAPHIALLLPAAKTGFVLFQLG
jgi:hypothetical protein